LPPSSGENIKTLLLAYGHRQQLLRSLEEVSPGSLAEGSLAAGGASGASRSGCALQGISSWDLQQPQLSSQQQRHRAAARTADAAEQALAARPARHPLSGREKPLPSDVVGQLERARDRHALRSLPSRSTAALRASLAGQAVGEGVINEDGTAVVVSDAEESPPPPIPTDLGGAQDDASSATRATTDEILFGHRGGAMLMGLGAVPGAAPAPAAEPAKKLWMGVPAEAAAAILRARAEAQRQESPLETLEPEQAERMHVLTPAPPPLPTGEPP
jgi:hypothetical protein